MAFLLLWLFFFLKIDCSFHYISLKALCHYEDPNVSEAIEKKIYGSWHRFVLKSHGRMNAKSQKLIIRVIHRFKERFIFSFRLIFQKN